MDIVFDGPPGPEAPRFIEVEDESGKGISPGEWLQRADGYWVLRLGSSAGAREQAEEMRAAARAEPQGIHVELTNGQWFRSSNNDFKPQAVWNIDEARRVRTWLDTVLPEAASSGEPSANAVIGACAHLQMATGSNAEWRAHEALKLLQSILPKGDEKTGQPKPLWPNDSDRWGDPE
jgi:hypothetical protein